MAEGDLMKVGTAHVLRSCSAERGTLCSVPSAARCSTRQSSGEQQCPLPATPPGLLTDTIRLWEGIPGTS